MSSLSRTGLFLASLRGAPHGPSKSRTGFELRSTILPLYRSRPLGKFPTTISYRNGVKASHGGSSLSRTGLPSMSRAGLFLASLRGGLHGPSKSRAGFELRSTILPLHQTYQPFLTEMGLGLRMEGPHRAGRASPYLNETFPYPVFAFMFSLASSPGVDRS